ncbi:YhcN/YlaJ family sporulation lipoprotein [Effusibacillus dendaii]|uniref:Sporulation protein n=1 Tax=Effusibacillus dendaii TaxID=2743772 RepID=A0A7I8DFL4_9BACL|nr:YhcN/YlaJ family sporulation lipoprotein [Effusibacillus dendaii]BCJ87656.1 hypothetical protein skT53_26410 [Effusibacillus dendaii]
MRTKWIAWTVLASLTAGMLSGCGGGSNAGSVKRMNTQGAEPRNANLGIDVDGDGDRAWLSGHNNLNNPPVNLRDYAPSGSGGYRDMTQTYSGGVTADRVADLAQSIQGVRDASVVIADQTAIVGLTLQRNVPQDRVEAIKQEVRRLLMIQAPVFRSVRITTDNALSRRIFDAAQNARNGHPISATDQEFSQLVKTVPEVLPR